MSDRPRLRVVQEGDASGKRLPLRIVIADDDRDTVTTLKAILADEGHQVHSVLRGDEVLELCRLFRPDVVIADVDMPGMSGYAVARELRARHGELAPLLIAVSGKWTKPSDRVVGETVGFDHYLLKPADPAELIAILARFASVGQSAEQKSGKGTM